MRLFLNAIAHLLPNSLRDFGSVLYNSLPQAVRYGRAFTNTVEFLEDSQYWNKERLHEYQFQMTLSLLRHAYKNVPFYTMIYKREDLHPNDIRTYEDFMKLPLVSKKDVQEHLPLFQAKNFSKSKFQYHTTGGSTGQPVGLYWEADRTVPMEWAFMNRQWKWVGYDPNIDRSVVLRGIPISGGKLWEKVSSKQIRFSSYHLDLDTIRKYIDIMHEFKPVAMHAYPSAAFIFAQFLRDIGSTEFPGLQVVLCGSENLYDWQREIIEDAFKCRVYSWYGQSEYVALGGECECSNKYHFYSEYGLTEVLRLDGSIAVAGESGEIVATGFNNFAMPLIRYKTEDLAVVSKDQSCRCGRNYLMIDKIDGRLQEMAVSRSGNLISMTAINMHTDAFDEVYKFQFLQKEVGHLVLRVVKKDSYTQGSENKILMALRTKLKDQFDLKIEYVQSIEVTPRGKSRSLIQEIPLGKIYRDPIAEINDEEN